MRTNLRKVVMGLCGPMCVSGLFVGAPTAAVADHHGVQITVYSADGAGGVKEWETSDANNCQEGVNATQACHGIVYDNTEVNVVGTSEEPTELASFLVTCPNKGHFRIEASTIFEAKKAGNPKWATVTYDVNGDGSEMTDNYTRISIYAGDGGQSSQALRVTEVECHTIGAAKNIKLLAYQTDNVVTVTANHKTLDVIWYKYKLNRVGSD